MLRSSADAPKALREGQSLLGGGWQAVENFDDLSDLEDYETDEEEVYVTLDLGAATDNKSIQTDTDHQLIGLDTPLPFLKLGNQVYQGDVTPLIGDEVILGLVRNQENPHNPSHPPLYVTNHRITFRPVTLERLIPSPPPDIPSAGPSRAARGPGRPKKALKQRKDGTADPQLSSEDRGATSSPTSRTRERVDDIRLDEDKDVEMDDSSVHGESSKGKRRSANQYTGAQREVVISDYDAWQEFDPSTIPDSAKVYLSPAIDPSAIPGLEENKRRMTKKEAMKIKAGKPLKGKGSRVPWRRKDDPSRNAGSQTEMEDKDEDDAAEADDAD